MNAQDPRRKAERRVFCILLWIVVLGYVIYPLLTVIFASRSPEPAAR